MKKKIFFCVITALFFFQFSYANVYYVSTTGNDLSGDGSSLNPWKTLMYAATKVAANQGHTIQVSAGTFVENGQVQIPHGVNVTGAGVDVTIFKAASSFYYHPADPGYSTNQFLFSLSDYNLVNGSQTLSNFTIDGDSKQLHGGIYVRYLSNVVINQVKVQYTNFSGIWLWDVQDSQLTNTQLINCSWGSTGYCSGALNLGNLQRVEISQLNVNENTGYGVKAIGPDGYNDVFNTKIHDSHVSVTPYGLWNNGSAPNIAIELWNSTLVGCEIYNTYVDNTISLVNSAIASTGIQTIRVHDNTLDMQTRASGAGYGLELSIHDAEVDHNYFLGGNYGIANWDNPMQNWNIHHNTFYALSNVYPGDVVRSQWSGLHNLKLYNNTIEFTGTQTMNVIGVYGGSSDNIDIKNNLVINSNTSYSYYPNQLVHTESGATVTTLTVLNNSTTNLDPGDLITSLIAALNPLISLTSLSNPSITKAGNRPSPYYIPAPGSSLIDAGLNVGYPYTGAAPDIGAFESGASNLPPQISITSPTNNSSFSAGSTITINVNATDSDGTIAKVDFFQGTTLLGTAPASPYSFAWASVPAGNYSLTAKATDNLGATTTSTAVAVKVTAANVPPTVSITSPTNNSSFSAGSTITINVNATDSDGTIAKVDFFQGTTLLGTALASPYSFAWASVPAGNYSLTAKATDNLGSATTTAAIAITVTSSNILPVVSITSPTNNAIFPTGSSSITIKANATDTDGTVAKVEFFRGTTKLGQVLTSPYNFVWSKPATGSYSITAKATDNLGAATTSAAIVIKVDNAPAISLTSPVANTSFTSGSTITINATATDSDGKISKVEFFQGATKLGQATTSPYSFSWANVPAGNYSLAARATDNLGVTTASTVVPIVVSDPSTSFQMGLIASDATLSGGMTLTGDPTASSGSYFAMPAGSGTNYYIPPPAGATFNFQLPKNDVYFVWAHVKSPTASNQGYYIYDGEGNWINWAAGVNVVWKWVKISDSSSGAVSSFSFTQGLNEIQMAWNDDNVQIDRILITNDATLVPAEPIIANEISVFPNPIVSTFTIQYTSSVAQQAQISIVDQYGTFVTQTIVTVNVGLNNIVLSTDNIYNGTYILIFAPSTGDKTTTRIVINR